MILPPLTKKIIEQDGNSYLQIPDHFLESLAPSSFLWYTTDPDGSLRIRPVTKSQEEEQ